MKARKSFRIGVAELGEQTPREEAAQANGLGARCGIRRLWLSGIGLRCRDARLVDERGSPGFVRFFQEDSHEETSDALSGAGYRVSA